MEQWDVDPELDTSRRCAHLVETADGMCPERMWADVCSIVSNLGRYDVCCSAAAVQAAVLDVASCVCLVWMAYRNGFAWLCENTCVAHIL